MIGHLVKGTPYIDGSGVEQGVCSEADPCILGMCLGGACRCEQDVDCIEGRCLDYKCSQGFGDCTSGLMDGDETDIDCGGIACMRCPPSSNCNVDADCQFNSCQGGLCISCSDSVKNGDETDVDCGGSCGACGSSKTCSRYYVDDTTELYVPTESGSVSFIQITDHGVCTLWRDPYSRNSFLEELEFDDMYDVLGPTTTWNYNQNCNDNLGAKYPNVSTWGSATHINGTCYKETYYKEIYGRSGHPITDYMPVHRVINLTTHTNVTTCRDKCSSLSMDTYFMYDGKCGCCDPYLYELTTFAYSTIHTVGNEVQYEISPQSCVQSTAQTSVPFTSAQCETECTLQVGVYNYAVSSQDGCICKTIEERDVDDSVYEIANVVWAGLSLDQRKSYWADQWGYNDDFEQKWNTECDSVCFMEEFSGMTIGIISNSEIVRDGKCRCLYTRSVIRSLAPEECSPLCSGAFYMDSGVCNCCPEPDCPSTSPCTEISGSYTCHSCSDGEKNGDETDVDCGGSCGGCGGSKICILGSDCATGECSENTCVGCGDNVKNGDETDIDCGGSCDPCAQGSICSDDSDCAGYCDGTCQSCTDGIKGPSEPVTDQGRLCATLPNDSACYVGEDCTSGYCEGSMCRECIDDATCGFICHNYACLDTDQGNICSAGTFDHDSGFLTACENCPAGYTSEPNAKECDLCEAGKHSESGGLCVDIACGNVDHIPAPPICHGECNVTGSEAEYICESCIGRWYGENCIYHADCVAGQKWDETQCVDCDHGSYGNLYCTESVCDTTPCQNEGVCIEKDGDWECLCEPGFSGNVCQFEGLQCVNDNDDCVCKDGYFGEYCEYSYICNDAILTIDGCIPECVDRHESQSQSCLCGDTKLDGQYCVDGMGYQKCENGLKNCFDGNNVVTHYFNGPQTNFLSGCKTSGAANYVADPMTPVECVDIIDHCTHTDNCTDSVCIGELCRNPCEDNEFFNGTCDTLTDCDVCDAISHCDAGTGKTVSVKQDGECVSCEDGKYQDGVMYECEDHMACAGAEIEETGTTDTDTRCHDPIDCIPPTYQVFGLCQQCDGYVQDRECVEFGDCPDGKYSYIPPEWDGTVDLTCVDRRTCESGTPYITERVTEDTICVDDTLDECMLAGVNFTDIKWQDRDQLFRAKIVSMDSAVIPMILCDDIVLSKDGKEITVSDQIDSSGIYAYSFDANTSLCTKERPFDEQECNVVEVKSVKYDICISEFVDCDCNGCIHGECDGTCSNCTKRADGTIFEGDKCDQIVGCDQCNGICTGDLRDCECSEGWEGYFCESDINECAKAPCGNGVCRESGTDSSVALGNYICTCNDDFEQSTSGILTCIHICSGGECGHGYCVDNGKCQCDEGWSGYKCDVAECDIECAEHEVCSANVCVGGCDSSPCNIGTCTNTTGGTYTCACPSGYSSDGTSCVDDDECTTDPCDTNADCDNTPPGSYTCTCELGFTGDGTSCVDDDECASETDNNCSENADCDNTPPGSYTCTCKSGFSGDGMSCVDDDECTTDPCHTHADCDNTPPGSYTCTCDPGFTGDGFTCVDDDECASETDNNCSEYADCDNKPGSYTCTCNPGFTGDGVTCANIDECSTNPCGPYGDCDDLVNEYKCTCEDGYKGEDCTEIVDRCENNPCNGGVCTQVGIAFSCDCSSVDYQGDTCTEWIDDCIENPCGPGACVDAVRSHLCDCPPTMVFHSGTCVCGLGKGWTGSECEDCPYKEYNMDHALTPCKEQVCDAGWGVVDINNYDDTTNATNCEQCPSGWVSERGNTQCVQSGPCWNSPCGIGGTCVSDEDTYTCGCIENYKFESGTCILENNCANCEYQESCTNEPTGMVCTCSSGFAGDLCSFTEMDWWCSGCDYRCTDPNAWINNQCCSCS